MNQTTYAKGKNMPTLEKTIGQHFDLAASQFAGRDALVMPHQDIRRTYAQLHAAHP